MRQLSSLQNEPAHIGHRVVIWYAGRVWTLWVLLITLPLAVLVADCVTLARNWRGDLELRQAAQ